MLARKRLIISQQKYPQYRKYLKSIQNSDYIIKRIAHKQKTLILPRILGKKSQVKPMTKNNSRKHSLFIQEKQNRGKTIDITIDHNFIPRKKSLQKMRQNQIFQNLLRQQINGWDYSQEAFKFY